MSLTLIFWSAATACVANSERVRDSARENPREMEMAGCGDRRLRTKGPLWLSALKMREAGAAVRLRVEPNPWGRKETRREPSGTCPKGSCLESDHGTARCETGRFRHGLF